jgi:hypothetical protein
VFHVYPHGHVRGADYPQYFDMEFPGAVLSVLKTEDEQGLVANNLVRRNDQVRR